MNLTETEYRTLIQIRDCLRAKAEMIDSLLDAAHYFGTEPEDYSDDEVIYNSMERPR